MRSRSHVALFIVVACGCADERRPDLLTQPVSAPLNDSAVHVEREDRGIVAERIATEDEIDEIISPEPLPAPTDAVFVTDAMRRAERGLLRSSYVRHAAARAVRPMLIRVEQITEVGALLEIDVQAWENGVEARRATLVVPDRRCRDDRWLAVGATLLTHVSDSDLARGLDARYEAVGPLAGGDVGTFVAVAYRDGSYTAMMPWGEESVSDVTESILAERALLR